MLWHEAIQQPELVMRGLLSEHSATDVLLALSLSRQFTSVELLTGRDEIAGRVYLKAGMVLAVEPSEGDRQLQTFQQLIRQPLKGYVVYRMPSPSQWPSPIGRLTTSLMIDVTGIRTADAAGARTVAGETASPAMDASAAAAPSASTTSPSAPPAGLPAPVRPPSSPPTIPGPAALRHDASTAPAAGTASEGTLAGIVPPRTASVASVDGPASSGTGCAVVSAGSNAAASVPAPAPSAAPAPSTPPRAVAAARSATSATPVPRGVVAASPTGIGRPARPASTPSVAFPKTAVTAAAVPVVEAPLRGAPPVEVVAPAVPSAMPPVIATSSEARANAAIAIASPKGGCGKTTIALNLAVASAHRGFRVALVDADPNGDILSALGASGREGSGAYEVLAGMTAAAESMIRTVVPNLRLLPALGPGAPVELFDYPPDAGKWTRLFAELHADTDVIIVDTPAGMFGLSAPVIAAATDVVGILQAESIPYRSFPMFQRALPATGPRVLGVVANMVNADDEASLEVLRAATSSLPDGWLLGSNVPRSADFNAWASRGTPIASSQWSSLFDSLAKEVLERAGLRAAKSKPGSFLL